MGRLTFPILLVLLILGNALYDRSSPVTQLTSSDFSKTKKGIWLVQFYAPWCGHCKSLAPEYEKAARALSGIANIAAIDASNERVDVQIQGYPTIKLFVDGRPTDYDGPRSADGIVDFMLRKFKSIANERMGGGSSSGSGQGSGSGDVDEKDVIVLSDSDFEENVFATESAWFVQFYAPWCGHCKNLVPEWAQLATELKGEVKVAKVDATQNKQSAQQFGVRGYPSIKFFPAGAGKDASSAVDYQGQRTAAAMAEWARQKQKDMKHWQHIRLNSQATYDEYCAGKYLCVITFLPHILDSSEAEREQHLELIKEVGLKQRGKPFKFLWSQAGDHFQLQERLGTVGVGYPVVVTIYKAKEVFSKLKRSFSAQNFDSYLSSIIKNKQRFNKLPALEKLKAIAEEPKKEGCDEYQCTGPAEEVEHPQEL